MSAPRVTVRKTSHRVHRWGLGVTDGAQWWDLPYFTFPRRREAVQVQRALEALEVDWNVPPAAWAAEVLMAVLRLQAQTPGWAAHAVSAPGHTDRAPVNTSEAAPHPSPSRRARR